MDVTVTQTLEWKTASRVRYPNITVCNKRYFALHRLEGETINPQVSSPSFIKRVVP